MEDDENKDIFVDLKNFNCKKCGIFPKDLTIYHINNRNSSIIYILI